MKIRVVIPCWKRPEVTKFCFDEMVKLIALSKNEIEVTCVISEVDYQEVCESYGFEWVWAENNPLGRKINIGIKKAMEHKFDYLMMMNSDDVVDVKLIDEVYESFFDKPYFGINRVTYVNFETKEARDVVYDFSVLGIAKCISREVVDRFKGNLYPDDRNKGLDDGFMDNMIQASIMPTIVKYEGQLAWDFKSETNIWPWDHFKNKGTEVCYNRE